MVLERLSATRDAHDACHVVRVMRHGFDELFSPARFIHHVRPCSGYDFVSLSLYIYIYIYIYISFDVPTINDSGSR